MVTIGIDPHKASHTAVALDEEGRLLGELRVVATKAVLERLLRWAERWPERIWAVEGATGLGHLLAQQLVAHRETVLDVPATLAARARLLARGHGRKADAIDAASVARVAQKPAGPAPRGNRGPQRRVAAPLRSPTTCEPRRAAPWSTGSIVCSVTCGPAARRPSCRRMPPRDSSTGSDQRTPSISSARRWRGRSSPICAGSTGTWWRAEDAALPRSWPAARPLPASSGSAMCSRPRSWVMSVT